VYCLTVQLFREIAINIVAALTPKFVPAFFFSRLREGERASSCADYMCSQAVSLRKNIN
jgi:hypothetical protein